MKVRAAVTIDIGKADFENMECDIAEEITREVTGEVTGALKKSEAWRDLKAIIYRACLERIRVEIAEEYIAKVKGE